MSSAALGNLANESEASSNSGGDRCLVGRKGGRLALHLDLRNLLFGADEFHET